MPTRGSRPKRGGHRLFVAVDPPAPVAAELAGWGRTQRERGAGLRAVAPESIHLTLVFLGERPVVDVAPIAWAIGDAVGEWALAGGGGPVPLELGPPAWLPPHHPQALAVEARDPTGRLGALRAALGLALGSAVGWPVDGRRFRPHLTVGRLPRRRSAPAPLEPTPAGSFTVDEAILYRSFLEPTGAHYEALERVSLS